MIRICGATLREKSLIRRVERSCFKALGQHDFFTTDLSVVDQDTIRELNLRMRSIDKVTDVLSFPCHERLTLPVSANAFEACDFEKNRVMLGSIVICRQRAEEQAREYGHSYARELGFLTCHGLLHLLGFDHMEHDDEEIMTDWQRRIMALAKL